jgi:hypothetical protein
MPESFTTVPRRICHRANGTGSCPSIFWHPSRSLIRCCQRCCSRPDAHVVNMCSISGLVAGGRLAAYHTSKFGLIGFTEALRAEYGRRGLGVTAICPGPVTTRLYESGVSGSTERKVPSPPRWLCATPERVAEVTLRAISARSQAGSDHPPRSSCCFSSSDSYRELLISQSFQLQTPETTIPGPRGTGGASPLEAVQPLQKMAPSEPANESLEQRAA